MTFKSYLESGGEKCPKCGSRAIKPSAPAERTVPGRVMLAMFCATCGARWVDTYSLAKAADL